MDLHSFLHPHMSIALKPLIKELSIRNACIARLLASCFHMDSDKKLSAVFTMCAGLGLDDSH